MDVATSVASAGGATTTSKAQRSAVTATMRMILSIHFLRAATSRSVDSVVGF